MKVTIGDFKEPWYNKLKNITLEKLTKRYGRVVFMDQCYTDYQYWETIICYQYNTSDVGSEIVIYYKRDDDVEIGGSYKVYKKKNNNEI